VAGFRASLAAEEELLGIINLLQYSTTVGRRLM